MKTSYKVRTGILADCLYIAPNITYRTLNPGNSGIENNSLV